MNSYLDWCNQVKQIPLDAKGQRLESANEVKVIKTESGDLLAVKVMRPETKYIPRLKILGEVAYSLFDWHLNPGERVTPNVCPINQNTLIRQFIKGWPGEVWRGELYRQKRSLEAADLVIVDRLLESRFAQRIALLDFIFLCQDRSARNWVERNNRFWAVDNGILWPYKGRHTDKEAVRTGKVDHLQPPMEALVSYDYQFSFKIGIFSSLYAGCSINDGLLMWLNQVDWGEYLMDLSFAGCDPLGYYAGLVNDWRFGQCKARANWLLDHRRFPAVSETRSDEWQMLLKQPLNGLRVWERRWEIANSEPS